MKRRIYDCRRSTDPSDTGTFSTMTAKEKFGLNKMIVWVISAIYLSYKSLLNIHQPYLIPRIKRRFAVANSIINI